MAIEVLLIGMRSSGGCEPQGVWLSVHPGGVSIRRLGEATLLE